MTILFILLAIMLVLFMILLYSAFILASEYDDAADELWRKHRKEKNDHEKDNDDFGIF